MRTCSKEHFSNVLCSECGHFVLGAGASAPAVPIASQISLEIMKLWDKGGVFPVTKPKDQNQLAFRIVSQILNQTPLHDIFRREKASLMSENFIRAALYHVLASPLQRDLKLASYEVFNQFPPGVIWNYNLDGFAERYCKHRHEVINQHGLIPSAFGGNEGADLLDAVQLYDISVENITDLTLLEKERFGTILPFSNNYDFVAIIGYTFGRQEEDFDDFLSFAYLSHLLSCRPRPVYIVDPDPYIVAAVMSDKLKSNEVYGINMYWNIFSRSLLSLLKKERNYNDIEKYYESWGNRLH